MSSNGRGMTVIILETGTDWRVPESRKVTRARDAFADVKSERARNLQEREFCVFV